MWTESAAPRSIVRRVVAVVVGLLVAWALGEVVLRLARPTYAPRIADYQIRPVGASPPSWVYEPGSTVVFEWDGDPIGVLPPDARQRIAVNDAGLRGELPPVGARTVVVLGDSFTFGEGVADGETFVELLRGSETAAGIRFVNAGVAGHGTVEEAARLEALLARFRPIAVIVVHVPNDAIPWQESAERGGDLLNVAAPSGSRLLSLVRAMTSRGDVEDWYLSYYRGANEAAWARSRDAMVWMGQTCAARGVRFGVVTFPLMHRLDDYPLTAITAAVRDAAKDAGGEFLDLTPAFAGKVDARELWVHPADRHPNGRAHAIAAVAMRPFVAGLVR